MSTRTAVNGARHLRLHISLLDIQKLSRFVGWHQQVDPIGWCNVVGCVMVSWFIERMQVISNVCAAMVGGFQILRILYLLDH